MNSSNSKDSNDSNDEDLTLTAYALGFLVFGRLLPQGAVLFVGIGMLIAAFGIGPYSIDFSSAFIIFTYSFITVAILTIGMYGFGYRKKWGLIVFVIFFIHDLIFAIITIIAIARLFLLSIFMIAYALVCMFLIYKDYQYLSQK